MKFKLVLCYISDLNLTNELPQARVNSVDIELSPTYHHASICVAGHKITEKANGRVLCSKEQC